MSGPSPFRAFDPERVHLDGALWEAKFAAARLSNAMVKVGRLARRVDEPFLLDHVAALGFVETWAYGEVHRGDRRVQFPQADGGRR